MAKILVIDDEQPILDILSMVLTQAGHGVVTASDGQAGLLTLAVHKVDLVITDIVMPNKEGIETIQQLRRSMKGLPIIAMSGGGRSGNLDMLDAAARLGASATLSKPFKTQEVLTLVDRLLRWYPPDHEVILYEAAQLPIESFRAQRLPLRDLADAHYEEYTTLVIPPLAPPRDAADPG